jgi:hypothetical protein
MSTAAKGARRKEGTVADAISLAEVVNRLLADDKTAVYFDRSTSQLVLLESPAGESERPPSQAPAHFERLPFFSEQDEIELARQFAETVENAENRQRLLLALSTGTARERFEAAVFRSRIANEWYRFRDERLTRLAKDWLESRNIPYVDDVTRAAD